MSFIKRLFNLYLYSSFHIGLGAFALTFLSFYAFENQVDLGYLLFVVASTIFLYCLHRFIGIKKIKNYKDKGRFLVINKYRNHILIYAVISGLLTFISFLQFDLSLMGLLVLPGIFSLLYTLPILKDGLRLRDYGYIKIFLIAMVWSWITIAIPLRLNDAPYALIGTLSLERFLFFIAITLPFDLRDRQIDKETEVKTLVHLMSNQKVLKLSYLLLVGCLFLFGLLYMYQMISGYYLIAYIISYIITAFCIYLSREKEHDYYYSGLLDGTMFLPLLFYMLIGVLA